MKQPLDVPAHPAQRARLTPLFHNMLYCLGPGADFFALYHAGVSAERRQDPYGSGEAPQRTPYWYHYRYLPGLGRTLGRVLVRLVPRAAYILWAILTELVMAAAAFWLWRRATADSGAAAGSNSTGAEPPPASRARNDWLGPFVVGILACSTPLLLELYMGQFTAFTLGLTLLVVLAADEPRLTGSPLGRSGALALGLVALLYAMAVEVKVFPLVVAPALLRRRVGRWAVLAAVAALVLIEVPIFRKEPALYRTFWDLNLGGGLDGMNIGNFGLTYILYRVGLALGRIWTEQSLTHFSLVLKVSFLGLATVAALAKRSQVLVAAATLVFAHVLSYPHVWEHHMSGVLPFGVALLIVRLRRPPLAGRGETALMIAALALIALPTPFYFQDPWHDPIRTPWETWGLLAHILMPLCKAVPTLVLFCLGIRDAWLRAGAHPAITVPVSK